MHSNMKVLWCIWLHKCKKMEQRKRLMVIRISFVTFYIIYYITMHTHMCARMHAHTHSYTCMHTMHAHHTHMVCTTDTTLIYDQLYAFTHNFQHLPELESGKDRQQMFIFCKKKTLCLTLVTDHSQLLHCYSNHNAFGLFCSAGDRKWKIQSKIKNKISYKDKIMQNHLPYIKKFQDQMNNK